MHWKRVYMAAGRGHEEGAGALVASGGRAPGMAVGPQAPVGKAGAWMPAVSFHGASNVGRNGVRGRAELYQPRLVRFGQGAGQLPPCNIRCSFVGIAGEGRAIQNDWFVGWSAQLPAGCSAPHAWCAAITRLGMRWSAAHSSGLNLAQLDGGSSGAGGFRRPRAAAMLGAAGLGKACFS
jgi:hypothetical protein